MDPKITKREIMAQWYELLFENYGHQYDFEDFTRGTSGECDFIERELNYEKGARILDIGCGTGRHCIELAMRYYKVTGIDLSASMLKRGREKALKYSVSVDFHKMDARNITFNNEFDLVMMICEGAFPLMETDEMNFQILKNAAQALKANGKIIFTTLNALFPLTHSEQHFLASTKKEGSNNYKNNSMDLMTLRYHSTSFVVDDLGNNKKIESNERYYMPSEITWMLKSLNFRNIGIYGANLGAFSRSDKLTTEDFEMLVVAEK